MLTNLFPRLIDSSTHPLQVHTLLIVLVSRTTNTGACEFLHVSITSQIHRQRSNTYSHPKHCCVPHVFTTQQPFFRLQTPQLSALTHPVGDRGSTERRAQSGIYCRDYRERVPLAREPDDLASEGRQLRSQFGTAYHYHIVGVPWTMLALVVD